FLGARMGSETTAAATGQVGVVRRDPMAMLPFCGYNLGTYFRHWLNIGNRLTQRPKIFSVNWFRVDDQGSFIWPGFGENMRVLKWIIDRVQNNVEAKLTPAGLIPRLQDLDLDGINISKQNLSKLFDVNMNEWGAEVNEIRNFLTPYRGHLPPDLWEEHNILERQVKAFK
ncbi:MAG: phosphoenolpyruvate carboxykinase (GTP), partial [Candidatus Aminicenantes bacterium]|nr:phosphoenolpyruvate carboxykinase (GTP) [Candidatus Aminicenantes bacterium]